MCEISQQQGGEGEPMETIERGVEPFVVSGEATKACRPRKAAFDHPAAGQQHERLDTRSFEQSPGTTRAFFGSGERKRAYEPMESDC